MLTLCKIILPEEEHRKKEIHRNTPEEYVRVWGMHLSGSWSHWKPVISEWASNQEKEWLCAWGKHSQHMIILTLCLRETLFCYPKFDSKGTVFVVFHSWEKLDNSVGKTGYKTTSAVAAAVGLYQQMPWAYNFTHMGQVCSGDCWNCMHFTAVHPVTGLCSTRSCYLPCTLLLAQNHFEC